MPIDKRICAGLESCIFKKACLADPALRAKMLKRCSVLRLESGESLYMGENVSTVLLHVSGGIAGVTSGGVRDSACVSVQYPGSTMNIPYAVSAFKPNNWLYPLTDCTVVSIPIECVFDMVSSNDEMTYALLDGLSENVSNLAIFSTMISIKKPDERIRSFLSYSRERCGESGETFTLKAPQHMLAFATQLSRYSVSRALRELEGEGFLRVGYGSVTLLGD